MAEFKKEIKISFRKSTGVFLVLAPFVLVGLMAFSTLVIDLGMLRVSNAQLQNTVDAAALAGANALVNGNSAAITAATTIANTNTIIGNMTAGNVQVTLGTWDSNSNTFTATTNSPDAVKVSASVTPPLFFSNLFSSGNYTVTENSTAALLGGPRDIIFIVDLSPGMSQYSQLSAFPGLSVSTIVSSLQAIYNAMQLPQLGNMTWTPRLLLGTSTSIINSLGLQSVAYPFPSGSWKDYVKYVQTDASLLATGYQNEYGYLTFVNYLLSQQPEFSQTPTLWKTPEQPLQSAKDSIDYFLANSVTSADNVGLVTYNANSGNTATLEQPLTNNFGAISSILDGNISTNTPGRQAAHYSTNDNMLSAISAAVSELNTDGQQSSQWIIYLLTSAQLANNGIQAIINQANSAASNNITINVIVLGSSGDVALMQQIAQITGGTSIQTPPSTDFGQTLGQLASISGKAQIVQ